MILLILGSAGSGKTTLSSLLSKKFKVLKIYTTRPRRIDDKENYIFVSKRQFLSLYKKKKILTKVNILDNYYGLENSSLNNCEVKVAVGDYFTINQLRIKGIDYIALYLDVPLEICKNRMLLRGDDLESVNKKIALEYQMAEKEKSLCSYVISNYNSIENAYDVTMELIECLIKGEKVSDL